MGVPPPDTSQRVFEKLATADQKNKKLGKELSKERRTRKAGDSGQRSMDAGQRGSAERAAGRGSASRSTAVQPIGLTSANLELGARSSELESTPEREHLGAAVTELRDRGVLGGDTEESVHVLVEAIQMLSAQVRPCGMSDA